MSTHPDPALREALYFSALTYLGWSQPLAHQGEQLGQRMRALHAKAVSPGVGKWEILWGPATHRMMQVPPDDTCVCVWGQDDPTRLIVALRGTNPGSPLDWILGDFWAATQLPWELDGSGAAKVSASTALGVATTLNLRARRPSWVRSGSALWPSDTSLTAHFGRAASRLLHPALGIESVVAELKDFLSGKTLRLKQAVEAMKRSGFSELSVPSLRATWEDDVHRTAAELGRAVIERTRRAQATALVDALDGLERRGVDGSLSLIELLHRAIENGTREIVVTGHSKAGAVAVALATWLAQTQKPAAPDLVGWDPTRQARVICRAFAGPTPGNAAFATMAEGALAGRCTRVFNPLDVVPHAWCPDDIGEISALYKGHADAPAGLRELGLLVAAAMKDLEYAHAGTPHPLKEGFGKNQPKPISFPLEVVYQHMDAYLRDLELDELTTKVLFA